jgi:hypothetical protein
MRVAQIKSSRTSTGRKSYFRWQYEAEYSDGAVRSMYVRDAVARAKRVDMNEDMGILTYPEIEVLSVLLELGTTICTDAAIIWKNRVNGSSFTGNSKAAAVSFARTTLRLRLRGLVLCLGQYKSGCVKSYQLTDKGKLVAADYERAKSEAPIPLAA